MQSSDHRVTICLDVQCPAISVVIKVSAGVQRNILRSSRVSMSHRLDFIDQTSRT